MRVGIDLVATLARRSVLAGLFTGGVPGVSWVALRHGVAAVPLAVVRREIGLAGVVAVLAGVEQLLVCGATRAVEVRLVMMPITVLIVVGRLVVPMVHVNVVHAMLLLALRVGMARVVHSRWVLVDHVVRVVWVGGAAMLHVFVAVCFAIVELRRAVVAGRGLNWLRTRVLVVPAVHHTHVLRLIVLMAVVVMPRGEVAAVPGVRFAVVDPRSVLAAAGPGPPAVIHTAVPLGGIPQPRSRPRVRIK